MEALGFSICIVRLRLVVLSYGPWSTSTVKGADGGSEAIQGGKVIGRENGPVTFVDSVTLQFPGMILETFLAASAAAPRAARRPSGSAAHEITGAGGRNGKFSLKFR